MDQRRKLYSGATRKPPVSTPALLCVLSVGLALNLCPIIDLFTDPNSPDLCFINWYKLLYIGYCFLNLIVALLRSSARRSVLRYGGWRVFLCGMFIVVSSYIFVTVVLDRSALWTWNTFESNFIKRLESNVVGIFETRPDFVVREFRTLEPMKLERQARYEGEDVRLVCENILIFNGRVTFHEKQVIWKHNKERIESSSRHHITTSFDEIPTNETIRTLSSLLDMDLHLYRVESKLDIYLIEDGDFGKFSCHVAKKAIAIESQHSKSDTASKQTRTTTKEKVQNKPREKQQSPECPKTRDEQNRCPCHFEDWAHMNLNVLPYQWTAEFSLAKIKPTRRIVSVPIGGIVSTNASYSYLNDGPSVIDFDHEINGNSFVSTCEGLDQSCSIFVYLYWFLWHDGGHYSNIPAFYQQLQMVEGVGGTSWQCVCPNTYGVHKFVFYRQFYNTTLGTYQVIDVEYPDTVELVPEEPHLLDLHYNGSKKALPLPEPSCWGNVETKACELLERLLRSLCCNYFNKEKQIFLCGLIFCLGLAWILTGTILRWVTNPCINMILGRRRVNIQPIQGRGTLAGLAPADNTVVKYDLYISYADEQTAMASEIAQALTSRGLKVCFRDNDVLGHEIVTQAVSRLIVESWKFLVIVSQEYVDSQLQNNFEMPLIIQRFHEGYINDRNVSLLPLRHDLISNVLNNFIVLDKCENSEDLIEDVLLWYGPSLFPNTAHIIRRRHYGFTSTSAYYVSGVCFYLLLCILLTGSVW
ncbi:uncharacterized protein [Haliotis cracherodii]|uniref:uncharacterized protein n=1 Tax=Haliotis cracherodii TaxID=6455 RepID=UPI0039EC7EC2